MSRTYHHLSAPREKLARFPDRYTGWIGEGIRRASAKAWFKHMQHKAARRFARKELRVYL